MSQELLRALNENRLFFESAGLTADVKAIDEKIAAVEAALNPKPKAEPKPKPAAKPAAKKGSK